MKKIKPGHTAFEYNSINPFVLEVLVNEVTGRMMNEVFGDRVWRKIGAQNDAYIAVTKWGLGSSWGFVNTCLCDMGRWGLVFTPSWKKISGEQIIPDAVLTAIQKGGDPAIYNKGRVGQQFEQSFPDIKGLANRYQWDIVFPDGDIYKGGVGGQGLYVSPARDTVVVWFSTGTAEHEIMGRAIVQGLGR